nr:MAG TPA: hypothetical protein [Caudoviricetes sp.]DAZ57686.1 MAG TPA: hypothetical protein [Caudoviricetes sp.]
MIVSKRSGGFLLPPRWRRYCASRRRFAFFISRFVGLARLGLATSFTQPRIVEGYTLCQLPL